MEGLILFTYETEIFIVGREEKVTAFVNPVLLLGQVTSSGVVSRLLQPCRLQVQASKIKTSQIKLRCPKKLVDIFTRRLFIQQGTTEDGSTCIKHGNQSYTGTQGMQVAMPTTRCHSTGGKLARDHGEVEANPQRGLGEQTVGRCVHTLGANVLV